MCNSVFLIFTFLMQIITVPFIVVMCNKFLVWFIENIEGKCKLKMRKALEKLKLQFSF